MPGLRVDAGRLSPAASASTSGLQAESAYGADVAFYRLRFSRVHPKRGHGPATTQAFHPANLSLDLARAANLLLGFSQHALVSICFVKKIAMVQKRYLAAFLMARAGGDSPPLKESSVPIF